MVDGRDACGRVDGIAIRSAGLGHGPIIPADAADGERRQVSEHAAAEKEIVDACPRMEHAISAGLLGEGFVPGLIEIDLSRHIEIDAPADRQGLLFRQAPEAVDKVRDV